MKSNIPLKMKRLYVSGNYFFQKTDNSETNVNLTHNKVEEGEKFHEYYCQNIVLS